MAQAQRIGVLLMTYGSPETLADLPQYLSNVRGGRALTEEEETELVTEFRRRYELIGGSPLLRITREQAAALQTLLNEQAADGAVYEVDAGMRFAPPYLLDVAETLAQGKDQLVGIIMSPQYSPILMRGYVNTLTQAVEALHRPDLTLKIAGDWHMQPDFLQAVAGRVRQALDAMPADVRANVPVLLSAHSMPLSVIEKEPDYIHHLHETAAAVAELAGLSQNRWQFCYQSAGHSPEPWLKPDFADLMPVLAEQGHTHVLIAPVQFLADHLEILYDIEIGAREQAEEHGIVFHRTESLNTDPHFIRALAGVVRETLAQPSTEPATV